ncbi:mCG145068, partial [Mus musculus]
NLCYTFFLNFPMCSTILLSFNMFMLSPLLKYLILFPGPLALSKFYILPQNSLLCHNYPFYPTIIASLTLCLLS